MSNFHSDKLTQYSHTDEWKSKRINIEIITNKTDINTENKKKIDFILNQVRIMNLNRKELVKGNKIQKKLRNIGL